MAQEVAAACTDRGAPIDEESAAAVVGHFADILPADMWFDDRGYEEQGRRERIKELEREHFPNLAELRAQAEERAHEWRLRYEAAQTEDEKNKAWREVQYYQKSVYALPKYVAVGGAPISMQPGGSEGVKGEGAVSKKPFNVLLDMRQLIEALTGGVIAVSGAIVIPWLAVFAALYIWCTLSRAATVELSEREASVLWTLWMRRAPANNTSPNADLLRAVNRERKTYGHSPITGQELEDALHQLERIRSIERYSQDKSRWWLREWVVVEYE